MTENILEIINYFNKNFFEILKNEIEKFYGVDIFQERIRYLSQKKEEVQDILSTKLTNNHSSMTHEHEKFKKCSDFLTQSTKHMNAIKISNLESQEILLSYIYLINCIGKHRFHLKLFKQLKLIQNYHKILYDLKENNNTTTLKMLCQKFRKFEKEFKRDKKIHFQKIITSNMPHIRETILNFVKNYLSDILDNFDSSEYRGVLDSVQSLNLINEFIEIACKLLVTRLNNIFINRASKSSIIIRLDNNTIKIFMKQNFEDLSSQELIELYKSIAQKIWNLMKNCILLFDYHFQFEQYGIAADGFQNSETLDIKSCSNIIPMLTDSLYVTIEKRLSEFLEISNFNCLNIEEFIEYSLITQRIIYLLNRFTSNNSQNLEASFDNVIKKYISNYHESVKDEQAQFLECESWEPCQLPDDIKNNYSHLNGPSFLIKNCLYDSLINKLFQIQNLNEYILNDIDPFEWKFDYQLPNEAGNNIQNNDICMKNSTRDMYKLIINQPIKYVSNTVLNLFRISNRYIEGMSYFSHNWPPSTFFELNNIVIISYLELFADSKSLRIPRYMATLFPFEKKFQRKLNKFKSGILDSKILSIQKISGKSLDWQNLSDSMILVQQRIIGIQSFSFITQYLVKCYHTITNIYNPDITNQLLKYYKNLIYLCAHSESIVLHLISQNSFDEKEILAGIKDTKFDTKEITSKHSSYIDTLISNFTAFKKILDETQINLIEIDEYYIQKLWTIVANRIIKTLIEGYSQVKKCSNEGRALMQLDFKQLTFAFQDFSKMKQIPQGEDLEFYIKASYLSVDDLDKILETKKNIYTKKQIKSLKSSTFFS